MLILNIHSTLALQYEAFNNGEDLFSLMSRTRTLLHRTNVLI